jgi:ParB-like chromosome segregation protein Spo0J
MQEIIEIDVSLIKRNDKNPRIIKDNRFKQLVNSVKEFPEMLKKRPLICYSNNDGTYTVLGGNMRLEALKKIGIKKVPVILCDDWDEAKKRQFIIKDNISFGNWDFEILANEFDLIQLQDWGLEEINFCKTDLDELDNNEIELEEVKKFTLVLQFETEEEFDNVKKKLFEHGRSPSEGLINIINKLNI